MRIQPPSMWDDPSLNKPQVETTQLIKQPPNPRAPFFSSIWRSFTATTPPPAKRALVEKRKDDKTITITNTETVTEQLTIYHNQTVYTTLTTEVFFTHNITIFQPTTVIHNMTMTTTSPLTVSVPVTNTVSISTTTTTSTTRTSSHTQPSAAANSEVAGVEAVKHDGLSTKWILAIVFGVLGFVVLLGAVLWGVRWFLQKYRRERVERKRLQMEANEMPVMKVGKERGGEGDGGVFVIE